MNSSRHRMNSLRREGECGNKKRNSLERAKGDSASQGEKAAIVQELKAEGYRLTYLLKAMELSRSTYYFEIGKKILLHSEMKAC